MGRTTLTGYQITDGSVQRDDIDVITSGQALVRKIIAGNNVTITSTGVDSGTGDVTISASVSASSGTYVRIIGDTMTGNLTLPSATFNTSYTVSGTEPTGTMFWDSANHTASIALENGVVLQLGQEQHIYGKNTSGVTIANGSVCSLSTVNGSFITFSLTDATNEFSSKATIGVATQDILDNGFGYVTTVGTVRELNTLGLTEGSVLYVDPLNPGKITQTQPLAPNYTIQVGRVEYAHAIHGRIHVITRLYPKLVNLSDINGAVFNTTGQLLSWDNTANKFVSSNNINNYSLTTHPLSGHTDWPVGLTVTEIGYCTDVTSNIQAQLNTKAPLVSPALSGIPTAPTAIHGTSTTQLATTEFVTDAISGINVISTLTAGENVIIVSTGPSGTGDVTISVPVSALQKMLIDNATVVKVRLNANQTIPSSTWTKIIYNVKDYDTKNNFNTTTNRFTAAVSGYYQVTCSYQTTSNKSSRIGVYINGTEITRIEDRTDSLSYHNGIGVVFMQVGDILEFWSYLPSGGTISAGIYTYATIQIIN